jgi:hypothetical protein
MRITQDDAYEFAATKFRCFGDNKGVAMVTEGFPAELVFCNMDIPALWMAFTTGEKVELVDGEGGSVFFEVVKGEN